jgi:RHS repeat-associated protein
LHIPNGLAESQASAINGGEIYRFQVYIKQGLESDTKGVSLEMVFYDSSGLPEPAATVGRWMNAGGGSAGLEDDWIQYEGLAMAPSDAVSVTLGISASQLDGFVFFDDATFDEFDPGDTVYRSTYGLAGQPIATRVVTSPTDPDDGIYYIHTDHLGSVSAMSDGSSGALVGDIIRFDPFGDYRPGSSAGDITDRGFTGHKHNDYIKMIYMGARWYLPYLNRFLSADVIVPNPANPQSYNRYSYTENNPIRYNDPTGHCGADTTSGIGFEEQQALTDECILLRDELQQLYNINITGMWKLLEIEWLAKALTDTANFVGGAGQLSALFQDALTNKGSNADKITFQRTDTPGQGAGWSPISGTITLGPTVFAPDNYLLRPTDTRPPLLGLDNQPGSAQVSILHEIAHVLIDARPGIIGKYRQERQWGIRDPADNTFRSDSEGPYDGRNTFPGHINPFEDLATSIAIFITTGGANYPDYQFQMDFVRDNQDVWQ